MKPWTPRMKYSANIFIKCQTNDSLMTTQVRNLYIIRGYYSSVKRSVTPVVSLVLPTHTNDGSLDQVTSVSVDSPINDSYKSRIFKLVSHHTVSDYFALLVEANPGVPYDAPPLLQVYLRTSYWSSVRSFYSIPSLPKDPSLLSYKFSTPVLSWTTRTYVLHVLITTQSLNLVTSKSKIRHCVIHYQSTGHVWLIFFFWLTVHLPSITFYLTVSLDLWLLEGFR